MSGELSELLLGLGVVACASTLVWVASLVRRDAGLADLFWGLGFVGVAWVYHVRLEASGARSLLVPLLTTVWGVRLSLHLALRNLGRPEDYRYREMREARGASFWWVSLFTVFLLQATLLWIVSFPLFHVQRGSGPPGWVGLIGAGVAVLGLLLESVADAQLARFRRTRAHPGEVMDQGLWRYSRHPNYFGDAVFWWGVGLMALEVPGGWWTTIGPVVMTVLLLRVSGVTLLEQRLASEKPAYRAYAERTNAFIPGPRQNPRRDPPG